MLASLADVPASRFAAALGSAAEALPALQAREKAAAQDGIPSIEAPTGLPTTVAPRAAPPVALPSTQHAGAPAPATSAAAPPLPAQTTQAPLPGSKAPIPVAEPAAEQDGGGSWWSWLVDRLRNFFGSLPTSDPNVPTSAGPRQRLNLQGDADPVQNERERQMGEHAVQSERVHADGATAATFGENAIGPTVPRGRLRPKFRPAPPRPAGRLATAGTPSLPSDEREKFDEQTAPWVKAQVAEQDGGYRRERETYERTARKEQEDGARRIAEENERTRGEQVAMRDQARADVGQARQRWRDENRKIEAEFGDKATAKRRDIDREIGQKVESTHRDADTALADAEKQADAEKAKSEAEAAAKKREEESKPRSWWDRVKGAVSDAFSAIRSAITSIFDKLRQLVKGIIDAAKKAVHALIEAARSVIVGLIRAFGEFVKGLVTIALAAFPEAAARARAWIDGRVKAATDTVNRAAAALERAADAILDGIAKAIDAALGILQAALLKALDVLEKVALLPFQAMEALAKLIEWLAKNGKFVEAALQLETTGDSVIERLKNAIGGMIAEVPAQAHAKLQQFTASLGGGDARIVAPAAAGPAARGPAPTGSMVVQRAPAPDTVAPPKRHVPATQHLAGVLRQLDKGLTHLKDHWWDELKKVGWNLLWPWPAVWGDLKGIWAEVKAAFQDAYHLHVSKVIDHVLAIDQKLNSILGNLYGWFFIASVLIGALFGGVGALAGAAFAGEVGEALVVALIATETAVIVKSVADLALGNDTEKEDEEDYDKIAGSTMTIAITGAMMLLGEIAAKLAKSIWEGVAGVVNGEKAPEVKVEAEPGKPVEAPKEGGERSGETVPGDSPPAAESDSGVASEQTTADGHKIKILKDGRIFICSTCEELGFKYREELDASETFRNRLKEAETTADPATKDGMVKALEQDLTDARRKQLGTEDLPTKLARLDEIAERASKALSDLERAMEKNDKDLNALHGRFRGELRQKYQALEGELKEATAEIETSKELANEPGGPELIDKLRERLDDVRYRSEMAEESIAEELNPAADVGNVPRPHLNYPKNMLPTEGTNPYRSRNPSLEVEQAPEGGGYLDADENVWEVDRTKARVGKFFEWDVQTPDGKHINVGSDGSITH